MCDAHAVAIRAREALWVFFFGFFCFSEFKNSHGRLFLDLVQCSWTEIRPSPHGRILG
jgi:hypothetical protein